MVSDIVEEQQVDLLVLGTHGRLGLKKLVLGSEAETIFRQASCPVLTVGPHVVAVGARTWMPKNVVYPHGLLRNFPACASVRVVTGRGEPGPPYPAAFDGRWFPWTRRTILRTGILKQLNDLLPRDAADWCEPECVLLYEFPEEGILLLAQERSADLIIMGVRKGALTSGHLPWAPQRKSRAGRPAPF